MEDEKRAVHDFWNEAACGEELYLGGGTAHTLEAYRKQMQKRYELEPYIENFAQFGQCHDRDVLEVGVGLGADHQRFAEAGARLHGIDLTARAVEHTRKRFELFGLQSELQVADAESLPYPDIFF